MAMTSGDPRGDAGAMYWEWSQEIPLDLRTHGWALLHAV